MEQNESTVTDGRVVTSHTRSVSAAQKAVCWRPVRRSPSVAPGAVWWRSALGMCTVYPTPVHLDSEPLEERSRGRAEVGRSGSLTEGLRTCGVSPCLRVCLLTSRRSVFHCQPPGPLVPSLPCCSRSSSSPCGHPTLHVSVARSLLHLRERALGGVWNTPSQPLWSD